MSYYSYNIKGDEYISIKNGGSINYFKINTDGSYTPVDYDQWSILTYDLPDDFEGVEHNGTPEGIINKNDITNTKKFSITVNGHTYTIDNTRNGSAYNKNTRAVLEYLKQYGKLPDSKQLVGITNPNQFDKAIEDAKSLLNNTRDGLFDELITTSNGGYSTLDPEESAYNRYWNDIYSRNQGTLGAEAYDQLVRAEQAAGQSAIDLASAQAQQLGMAQAAQVKAITDSVRAERQAQLRAGMSESQIASQNMQSLIANTNALNDQIVASNMAALQGQQQIDNAQTTAYNNWLNTMNQTAQSASAMAAADAGDVNQQALRYMQRTGTNDYGYAIKAVTGQLYDNNKK